MFGGQVVPCAACAKPVPQAIAKVVKGKFYHRGCAPS